MSTQDLDRSCMDRLRAGDTKALEELYDRHTPMLYGIVLRIVGRVGDAEEVLQDVWTFAWKRADTWEPSRGSVAAWLLTVARSRAIDRFRSLASRRRAETAAPEPEPVRTNEPVANTAHRQLHERVTAALATLSQPQRTALELGYFGGLSQSEIAGQMGAPLGTVKSWMRQGLMRMRELVPAEERT